MSDWQRLALCAEVDPEIFHPDKGHATPAAKRICADCPVTTECLDFALSSHDQYGVYGGLSPTERSKLTRRKCRRCSSTVPARRLLCDNCQAISRAESSHRYEQRRAS